MLGGIGAFRGLGPEIPPLTTEPTVRPGPDLVPVVQCGVNAQGRRFVNIWVRNQGSRPTPRPGVLHGSIFGRGSIFGTSPFRILNPGETLFLESFVDPVFEGVPQLFIVVDADMYNRIPEDIDKSNNRVVMRCRPTPVVGPGGGP